jgi:hypothetical protein
MSKKILLLALAAISAAMFAVPAVAAAGEWSLDSASGKYPVSFTSVGEGSTSLTTDSSSLKVTCTGNTGSGKQISATTAEEVTILFTGCTENLFGSSCKSTGQETGKIKTTDLVSHNVILEASPEVRGVLLTPNNGHFASFVCGGGLVSVSVNGNGIIGEMTAPTTCGAVSKTSTLNFVTTAAGTQKWNQVTTTGTKFDLTSSQNGGAAATAGQDGKGTTTFAESMTFTC